MSDTTGKNIQSVQRAIDILNCFNENTTQLTLSDISEALDLNKSTVHGILSTLKNNGYLWQSRSGKYLLGPSLLSKYIFADDSRKALIVHNAKSHMEFLVKKYKYSVKLYYLNEGTPNYIYHISSVNSTYTFDSDFGNHPLYCSATGKLALSTMSEEQVMAYLKINPLKEISSYTITDKDALLAELKNIRKNTFSKEAQELLEGISAVSVPIIINQTCIAAISITGTSFHIDKDTDNIIKDLQEQTQIISDRMTDMGFQ